MTLIATAVTATRVEILSDTLCYGPAQADLEYTSKVHLLPHLDMAVMGRGSSSLTGSWLGLLQINAELTRSFDALNDVAQQHLRDLWQVVPDVARSHSGWIHHVGWSDSAGRFAACVFDAVNNFERMDIDEPLSCWPAPSIPLAPPTGEAEWVALGDRIYAEQAAAVNGMRCLIGGSLHLTTLTPGASRTERIHTFPDDSGWRDMLVGSLHRIGQMGPCPCGSGQPFIVCHMRWQDITEPCPCQSGKAFGDCHQVDLSAPDVFQYWRNHADDFHRRQDARAAAWAAANPDDDSVTRFPPTTIIPPRSTEPT